VDMVRHPYSRNRRVYRGAFKTGRHHNNVNQTLLGC
jgi:hypothetical protein